MTDKRYEVVEYDPRMGLDRHVGREGASQRVALPDIAYLWGPGRFLSNQIIGFTGIIGVISLPLGYLTWGFALDTLSLLFGAHPGGLR